MSMRATHTSAKVIADSISPEGHRLTTMELTYWRAVHQELMTHRWFSRNAASSRAITLAKMIARVRKDPAGPLSWPEEQKGMQGGAQLADLNLYEAKAVWDMARHQALVIAERLGELGLHKSVVNRLLEPFAWMTTIVTATEWDGFYWQRDHGAAMPELHQLASQMREAHGASEPELLKEGQFHLPYFGDSGGAGEQDYFDADELAANTDYVTDAQAMACQISSARCGRVSYLTQDGRRDVAEDIGLYKRLADRGGKAAYEEGVDPFHASPLEHVATPWAENELTVTLPNGKVIGPVPKVGNFVGWVQLRHLELAF